MQDTAPGFVEADEVCLCPLLEPVEVPVVGVPSLWRVTAPHSLVSSANFLRVRSIPLVMPLMKILKSLSPSTDPFEMPFITDRHPDTEPLAPGLDAAAGSLSIEQSAHRIRILPIWKEGCCVRGLAEVQVDDISGSSLGC